MTEPKVLLGQDGYVATVTLNRPEKLNAIDAEMLDLLRDIVDRLDRSPDVRVVLLTGAGGRAFSVGADIDGWSSLEPLDMWRRWNREGNRLFEQVASLRQPVIAVLAGYVLGGGLELALAADLRVAASGAQLGLPEVRLGTVPGWGGTQRLPGLVGPARAKHLVLTGRRIDAATAESWGLADLVAPDDDLLAEATRLAGEIAANAPVAVQVAKQLVNAGLAGRGGQTLESLAGGLTSATADVARGIEAFRTRTDPDFDGT